MKLGFIGTGNMAGAIMGGVIKNNVFKPEDIIAADLFARGREKVKELYGINVTDSLIDEHAQLNCMVGTAVIFLVENHGSIITNCHRAHVGTRLNT